MPRDYQNPYSDDVPVSKESMDDSGGDEEHGHIEGKSYVVPKEICADMKVGDEMVVKIVGQDEDSYQISYAPKEKGGKDEGGDMSEESAPAEGSMASYMS